LINSTVSPTFAEVSAGEITTAGSSPAPSWSGHFFWNYLHDFDIDNPNISLSLRNSLEEAFMEDKAIIEAQQTVFDADPNYQLLAIGADAALTYFRLALARRIEAERNAARAA